MGKSTPIEQRLLDKIEKLQNGCWQWTAYKSQSGCGVIWHNGRARDAYKVSYEVFVGTIPSSMDLHHVCHNRACINPEHLLPVSKSEHFAQLSPGHVAFKNAHKTHCPYGHPLIEGNLVAYALAKGHRVCLTCARKRTRECQAKKRAHDKV